MVYTCRVWVFNFPGTSTGNFYASESSSPSAAQERARMYVEM